MNGVVADTTRFKAVHIDEPRLLFGLGQTSVYPKDGLFLFGPVEPRHAGEVRIGAIGALRGLERLERWMKRVAGFISGPQRERSPRAISRHGTRLQPEVADGASAQDHSAGR